VSKVRDLTGQRFNRLLVIEFSGMDKKHNPLWKCLCDCGNEKILCGRDLRSGNTSSCGCLRRDDLVGKRFERLLVIDFAYIKNGNVYWLCKCDCGKEKIARASSLKSGGTRSCGCLVSELSKINRKKYAMSFEYGETSFNQLFSSYKLSAIRRAYSFELTKDEFRNLTGGTCDYCGKKPSNVKISARKSNGEYVYNGIDRVDSSKGYILENCVSCCTECNKLKGTMSREEFLKCVDLIYNHTHEYSK
jgi:hypothetical protein